MKRLKWSYVKREFEKEEYTLLTNEYMNAHQRLEYICPNGHKHFINQSNWKQGKRCLYCVGVKKRTIEEVKKYAKQFGYRCLNREYKDNRTKLRFRCNQGHIFEAAWSTFLQGHRCPICFGLKKKTIEEIKEYATSFNYKCLSTSYHNGHSKLEFRCDKKHIFRANWNNFRTGHRCPYCAKVKKKTIKEIKEYASEFRYKCLSKKYKNARTKLEFQCDKEHKFWMAWNNLHQGQRCPVCYTLSRLKNYAEEELTRQENYKLYVEQLSNSNFRKYPYFINPLNLERDKYSYHLDHIYSIANGFENNISPKVIASPINLQMLSAFDNISKNNRSDMTKEMLYELYYQFEREVKERNVLCPI